jgi:hypothetical protein
LSFDYLNKDLKVKRLKEKDICLGYPPRVKYIIASCDCSEKGERCDSIAKLRDYLNGKAWWVEHALPEKWVKSKEKK